MTEKIIIRTDAAPTPVARYAQGVVVGNMVYTAGFIALSPETGKLVGTEIREQTRQVIANLRAVLEAAGSDLNRVVKTTVYLRDLDDYAGMNEIFNAYFGANPPGRTTVQALLPLGALIEIDVIAVI